MSFGLDKCGRLIAQRGMIKQTSGIKLPEGHIEDISSSYKYLGILQSYDNHDQEVRQKAKTEYKKRIRQVLKTQLTAKNKITAINTYALPVIKYTACNNMAKRRYKQPRYSNQKTVYNTWGIPPKIKC